MFRLPRPPRSGNRTPLPRSPDVLQRAEASGTGELRDCPWRWGAGSPKPRGCTSGASRHRALGRASAGRLAGTGTSLSVLPAGKPVRRSERRPGWSASAGAPMKLPDPGRGGAGPGAPWVSSLPSLRRLVFLVRRRSSRFRRDRCSLQRRLHRSAWMRHRAAQSRRARAAHRGFLGGDRCRPSAVAAVASHAARLRRTRTVGRR